MVLKKNRMGYVRTVLCQACMLNEDLMSISFVGLSILEVIVKESKVRRLIEVCTYLKGTWIKEFNPLKSFAEKKTETETVKTPKELF
jgi:hypothetical protein